MPPEEQEASFKRFTMTQASFPAHSSLNFSKIRSRVAQYLSTKDCVSCALVCKDWHSDFVASIWHTLNFTTQAAFTQLPPAVIAEHGHLLTEIQNPSTIEHIQSLQHDSICLIKILRFTLLQDNPIFNILCYDLVRRSNKSLVDLHLTAPDAPAADRRASSLHYVPVDALIPHASIWQPLRRLDSSLKKLSLDNICLSREAFSNLLQSCRGLQSLALDRVIILAHGNGILFKHRKVRHIQATLAQVWTPDASQRSPSLLVHFPNLESWQMLPAPASPAPASPAPATPAPSSTSPTPAPIPTPAPAPAEEVPALDAVEMEHTSAALMKQVRDELRSCCPVFHGIDLDTTDSDTVSRALSDVFYSLQSIKFYQTEDTLQMNVLTSVLVHSNTLQSLVIISATQADKKENPAHQHQADDRTIFLIPRICHKLQVLSFESCVMDMDLVEDHEWACKDLKELRVKIKGLESPIEIDGCLEQFVALRNTQRRRNDEQFNNSSEASSLRTLSLSSASSVSVLGGGSAIKYWGGLGREDMSISKRVVRHLLSFKKLTTVWLGTKDYHVAV